MAEAADEGGVDVPVDTAAIIAKYAPSLTADPAAPPPAAPAPETPAPTPVAQAAAQVAAAPVLTPPAVDTPPATPPAPAPEEPTLRARQLANLARLEAEARQAKEQYEAKLKQLETGPAKPALPASMEELREQFEIDPDAALAALGFDDRSPIATRLMYKALGADAPPELQKEMEQRRINAELAVLKRKIEKRDKDAGDVHQQAVFAARIEATDRELSSFAHAVPTEMCFLAAQSRESPKEVYDALVQVATAHIKAGKFPSSRECAQAIEDQLAADYARLSKATQAAPPPAPTPAPTQSPTRPMETLNDADTRARPGTGDQPTAEQLNDPEYWTNRALQKLKAMGLGV